MALTVSDILARNLLPGMHLVSGGHGLENNVTWVNIMEILDTPESTQPGELLITTGYGLADRSRYSGLIARLKERGVSAVAIQTGYYIDRIPNFILEESAHYGLPVLDLPRNYSFSDILHILIDEISGDASLLKASGIDADWFQAALLTEMKAGGSNFFEPGRKNYLICIGPAGNFPSDSEAGNAALRTIRGWLGTLPCKIVSVSRGSSSCFLMSYDKGSSFHAVSYDLLIRLTLSSENEGLNFFAGIDRVPSEEALALSFRHALQGIVLLRSIEAVRGVCPYNNYDFISSFGAMYRSSRGSAMTVPALKTLIAKDRSRGTAYTRTLRVYLSENCSITKAAEHLNVHRHTLNNRLDVIRQMTGIDFRNPFTRASLYLSLMIHDYYGV